MHGSLGCVTTNAYTSEFGYGGPVYDGFLHMTDNMLAPSPMHIKYTSYVSMDFAYDGPIFLVPLSPKFTCICVCGKG